MSDNYHHTPTMMVNICQAPTTYQLLCQVVYLHYLISPYKNPMSRALLGTLFYRWGGSTMLFNLLKVTNRQNGLESGSEDIKTRVFVTLHFMPQCRHKNSFIYWLIHSCSNLVLHAIGRNIANCTFEWQTISEYDIIKINKDFCSISSVYNWAFTLPTVIPCFMHTAMSHHLCNI